MYVFSFSSHYLLLIYFIISNSQNANNNAFPELRNSYSAISDSKTGYLFVRCLPSVHPTVWPPHANSSVGLSITRSWIRC